MQASVNSELLTAAVTALGSLLTVQERESAKSAVLPGSSCKLCNAGYVFARDFSRNELRNQMKGGWGCHRKFGPPKFGPPGPNPSEKVIEKFGPPLKEMVPPG